MAMEFRVRWQREGRGQTTRVYQTWAAAYNRYLTTKVWDDVKHDTQYENMPTLEFVVLESREVPAWAEHEFQPEVTDGFRERTREAILLREPSPDSDDLPGVVPF